MTRQTLIRITAATACVALLSAGTARAAVTVAMGTVAPTDSPWHKVLKQMAEDWKKASNGQVTLRILADGSLGDELAMVQKMRAGVLSGIAISGAGLPEIEPSVMAFQAPMMFDSYDELDFVRERITPRLEEAIEAKGFIVLNWGDVGWIHFFSKKSARTLDDFRKMKLYIVAGDAKAENFYKLAGFKPVPLASTDILPMLQTGVIDAFQAPPLFALSGQFFGLAKYMNDVNWAPLVGATLVSKKTWNKIPVELRPKLLDAARVAGEKFRTEIRALSDQAVVEMEKRGLTVVKTTDVERAEWQKEAEAVWPRIRGPYVPPELWDEAIKARDEYRASQKSEKPGPEK